MTQKTESDFMVTTLPNGDVITAVQSDDPNFPGVRIQINGKSCVTIEQVNADTDAKNKTRLVSYSSARDEGAVPFVTAIQQL